MATCIRTTLEYQILESLRLKLGLHPARLRAPAFEVDQHGVYVRHCRLVIKENLASPLLLGLDLDRLSIHLYFRHCLYRTRSGNLRRFEGNYIYSMMSLEDPKSLAVSNIRRETRRIVALALTDQPLFARPLAKVKMIHTSIGPYVWTEPNG